jgi:hypothetical protein
MIPVENFRGYIASIVAGVLAIGGPLAMVYVWLQPVDPSRDLSVIFAALGAAAGGASTFLFLQDSAARSSRATERAAEASSTQTRAAANGHQLAALVESTPLEPLGADRLEGEIEPDRGEKHPDEPQRGLPEGADELGEEVSPNT